jgi:large subunit ribosomal protein L24
MHIKKGDKVIVITGKEKGKSSTVTHSIPSQNKVVLEGLNIAKKHIKAKKAGHKGGMTEVAMPINASNVKLAEKREKTSKKAK